MTTLHADKTTILAEHLSPEYFWKEILTRRKNYEEEKNDDQMGLLKQVIIAMAKPRGHKVR